MNCSAVSRPLLGFQAGVLALAMTASVHAQEFRALWVDAWGAGFRTPAEVSQLVSDARAAHLNALIVQVRRRGDCFYTGSPYEPKTADSAVPADFDPLADLIAKAHNTANGSRIEVHAWIVTYNIWNNETSLPPQTNHPYRLHPDWLTRNDSGATWDGSNYAFDPAHLEVQRHTFNVAMDIISRYDVDGFNFDYIRYAGNTWGYNPVAVARFNARYSLTGQPAAGDELWKQFRRDQVTALVRKVYLSAIALKPHVKISADTITWNPGPAHDAQWYSSARAWNDVLQDWRGWMEEGILDLNVPMAYFDQAGSYTLAWTNWNNFAKDHRFNRHVAIGPGIYMNSVANGIAQMRFARSPSPSGNPSEGVCGYSYRVTSDDGVSRATFLNAWVSPSSYDPITPPIFASPAVPPPMPWKTAPTKGHLKGFVSAGTASNTLDGASVSLEGPSGRAALTDATGFYGFVDLMPGSYTVTASASGRGSLSSNVVITAGVVSTVSLVISTNDTAPPAISDVRSTNVTDVGVTILWSTDEDSDSRVVYGPTPAYGSSVTNALLTRIHEVALVGLAPDTHYHFSVRSQDASGNLATFGDFTFTTRPAGVVDDIIIDNPLATVVGTWSSASSSTDKFGEDYRFNGSGNGDEYLQFTPNILVAGDYAVYEWHPQGGNRTTNAPHEITYHGGTQTIYVNQESGGGQWNLLGVFRFEEGTSGSVRITDAFPEPNGNVVLADAIKFAYVPTPPSITGQPQSLTVIAGANVTFSVTASGSRPLAYQWRLNGTNIPQATSNTLTRTNVQPADAGSYSVEVGNVAGTVTSSNASLIVNVRPAFVAQPQSLAVNQGAEAVFSALATGTPPLTYRWRFFGTNLPGANGTVFVRSNAQPADAGTYSVTVSNVAGVIGSTGAALTVLVPPTILTPPQSLAVNAGETFTFSVTATGTPPPVVQWRFNGVTVPGATGNTFSRGHARLSDTGDYSVVAINAAGTNSSVSAMLTVAPPPEPQIEPAVLLPGNQIRLLFTAQPGCVYSVERSPNLRDWTLIQTLTNISSQFAVTNTISQTLEFYRLTVP
jgi:uncharacterized lipoprotein YddW (UPF0748 family)